VLLDYLMNGQGKRLGWYLPRKNSIVYAMRVTDELVFIIK